MAFTSVPYNQFKDIPLVNLEEPLWTDGVDRCSPLLLDLAATAFSAVNEGIIRTESFDAYTIATTEPWVNEDGEYNPRLVRELGTGGPSAPDFVNLCYAGLSMVAAVDQVSRQLKHSRPVTTEHVSPTRVSTFEHTVRLPIPDERQSNSVGRILNTDPVFELQAKITTSTPYILQPQNEIGLSFAAAVHTEDPDGQSTTVNLRSFKDDATRKVGAMIDGGERTGHFIRPNRRISFTELGRYVRVLTYLRD